MKKIVLVFLILTLPVMVSAQLKTQPTGINVKDALRYGLNPIGIFAGSLLDPNKFHMTQSYSVSMTSFGGQAVSGAMYLNTMTYQISNPLSISLQWGLQMNNNMGSNNKLGVRPALPFNNGFFISGAQLKYKPSENSEINFEIRQVPNPYLYMMPYRY